jgi:hypothetical protein
MSRISSWILRCWCRRRTDHALCASGAETALVDLVGLRQAMLVKGAALLLQNLQIIVESFTPLGLVDLVFTHSSTS